MITPTTRYFFADWGVYLHAPLDMIRTPMDEILDATNGCGRAGHLDEHAPEKIYGLDISPACRVHDWMYGFATTLEEEQYADAIFAANVISLIQQGTKSKVLMWLRLRMAYRYISVVTLTNCIDVAQLEAMGIGDLVC